MESYLFLLGGCKTFSSVAHSSVSVATSSSSFLGESRARWDAIPPAGPVVSSQSDVLEHLHRDASQSDARTTSTDSFQFPGGAAECRWSGELRALPSSSASAPPSPRHTRMVNAMALLCCQRGLIRTVCSHCHRHSIWTKFDSYPVPGRPEARASLLTPHQYT